MDKVNILLVGDARPVNTLANRMQLLAVLDMADWVLPFTEDTPERLICAVLPDKLVKGGDYQVEDIAGYQCVTVNAGEVVVLDYQEGLSTSKIIKCVLKIKKERKTLQNGANESAMFNIKQALLFFQHKIVKEKF